MVGCFIFVLMIFSWFMFTIKFNADLVAGTIATLITWCLLLYVGPYIVAQRLNYLDKKKQQTTENNNTQDAE